MTTQIIKLNAGKYKVPVMVRVENDRLFLNFPFNRTLLNEVKVMKGAKWHGYDEHNPKKEWSIKNCFRNRFQLAALMGKNPYEHYDKPLIDVEPTRSTLYDHQKEMFRFGLTRKRCIFACQMRTGKTLAAIEVIEHSGISPWVWVGPRSAIAGVQLEFEKWGAKVYPEFMTYDKLRKLVQEDAMCLPAGIVFDECTKIKNPTAQRSQAAAIICDEMREAGDCYIIGMSGAPAPKSPADWWNQCEIVCPGFLREGQYNKFKERLAIITEKESLDGGVYPELTAWLDDEKKCAVCGKYSEDHFTDDFSDAGHKFEPSVNEVANLYTRMNGLVLVKFKKDCLDLPELQYRLIRVEQSGSIKRAASLILKTAPRSVTALMLLRELSDGFQYAEEEQGETDCERCRGTGVTIEYVSNNDEGESGPPEPGECIPQEESCPHCNGSGRAKKLVRVAKEVKCPKEQVLIDLLDEHEPIGRFVVYAGFQASIDRCISIALRYQWDVIRADGRGWAYFCSKTNKSLALTSKDMLKKFAMGEEDKILFAGQPGAAGMGIDLAASPSALFYSNSFNGEDRMQAVERIHGPAMDVNRGATIIDIVHLDIDEYVLNNLQEKQDLMNLTMGELRAAAKELNYDS